MKIILLIVALAFCECIFSQSFLNGSYENNSASDDTTNLSNMQFNSLMNDCYAFGWQGNLDIITSPAYCYIAAQDSNWYVALTGSGTDAFSMKLSTPLDSGQLYRISFYDKFCNDISLYTSFPLQLGLSDSNDTFGNVIHTSPDTPVTHWTERIFTFIAPGNGQFITVRAGGNQYDTWVQVDNFSISVQTIIEEPSISKIIIYPNPTNGIISVSEENQYEIEIINIEGKVIKPLYKNDEIDLSSQPDGIYFLKIITDKEIIVKKIIKQ